MLREKDVNKELIPVLGNEPWTMNGHSQVLGNQLWGVNALILKSGNQLWRVNTLAQMFREMASPDIRKGQISE